MEFIRRNKFRILVFFVVSLAAFLRFYDYGWRWGFAFDQAHDAIIARFAVFAHKLPLLGPFSSAGPFQTGGEWYWFIMLGVALLPFTLLGPWIFLTVCKILFVLFFIFVGKLVINKWFGLLVGLLVAISPVQISQAINLTNQGPIDIFSLLALFAVLQYIRTKSNWYFFLLGFSISTAISIHLQGTMLVYIAIVTLLILRIRNVKAFALLLLGGIIPILPIAWVDLHNHFTNTKNMLYYYQHDQYRISLEVLGRRWKTYLLVFWPQAWGRIITGNTSSGYFLVIINVIAFVWVLYKKKLTSFWTICLVTFGWMLVTLRYIRTPLFDSYLMFLHPFIFLFTAGSIYVICKWNKYIGVIFLLSIFIMASYQEMIAIKGTNQLIVDTTKVKDTLIQAYPNKKFAIYDFNLQATNFSVPLVYVLQKENLEDPNGIRIGVYISHKDDKNVGQLPKELTSSTVTGASVYVIQSSSSAVLTKQKWSFIDPRLIYSATEEWYSKKSL